MSRLIPLMAICIALQTGCAQNPSTQTIVQPPSEVGSVRPGLLMGYLSPAELPDSVALLPPAPEPGSARETMDVAANKLVMATKNEARWLQATLDAELEFPKATQAFACTLGVAINEEQTPHLYMLLRRTLTDFGLATYRAKNLYKRPRPFMKNDQPICTPEIEERLRTDGSYPSGHTAIGWGWGLVLAELLPEKRNELIVRGREFGESRAVCNLHWASDVIAGRDMASATFAVLHSNPIFNAEMALAKSEIQQQLANNHTADCP